MRIASIGVLLPCISSPACSIRSSRCSRSKPETNIITPGDNPRAWSAVKGVSTMVDSPDLLQWRLPC